MELNVLVINVFERPTAIWLYSRNLQGIDPMHISVYDAYPKSNPVSRLKREMEMMSDSFLGTGFLNRNIVAANDTIIHYADPMVPPAVDKKFLKSKLVTIFDNPKVLLSTDLYFKDSVGGRLSKKFLNKNIEKYKNFENTLVESTYVKNSLIDFGFLGSIDVIYLPISPSFRPLGDKYNLRRKLNLPQDSKLILSVSTDIKRKNLNLIERAMKNMNDNIKLVRVGKPLGNSITFSNISNEILNELYNSCDVLVMPSLEEGFGLPIIEALATGLPVVASDIEVFHEIGGEALEYVNPMSVESLISGIENSIANGENKSKEAKIFIEKYSYDRFKRNMLQYYMKLLK